MNNNKKDDMKKKIMSDPDFIYSPKYEFSLKKFTLRHDDGVENSHAAKVLLMKPEEIESIYQEAIKNLQSLIGADNE